jgi:hypothetical protein
MGPTASAGVGDPVMADRHDRASIPDTAVASVRRGREYGRRIHEAGDGTMTDTPAPDGATPDPLAILRSKNFLVVLVLAAVIGVVV